MSAATGHDPSALVRRYKFLGFPGATRERSLSYAELRAELGDENASALVVRIGALAQLHHLDQSSLGLSNAVAKILQSLTPDERRSIAQGNAIPPRIEAMVSAEVEAAKSAAAQAEAARHNASGAPLSAMAMAALGFGGRYAQASNRADSGGSRLSTH